MMQSVSPSGEPLTVSPFVETYTDEKLPWATTSAVHSFEKFPAPDNFPALLSEFAKRHQ
jgi:hypothetical protein